MDLLILGSSYNLPAHGCGGARARKNESAAQKSARPSEDGSAGGFKGGMPSRPSVKTEASPAALLGQSKAQQKSFLFLLEEKIRRAQNQKCRENFFAGRRALASGGGAASAFGVVFPLKESSRKVYNYSTKIKLFGFLRARSWAAQSAAH
jgi:hypothetical protein